MVTSADPSGATGRWVLELTGSGDHSPACRPPLIAHATQTLGPDALSWAVDLGHEMATVIISEMPAFAGGEEAFQTLRMGTEASVISGMLTVVTGDPAAVRAPQEALDGDRDFARRGIPLDLVLRGIRIGHAMTSEALIDAATRLLPEPERTAEIRRTSALLFEYVDGFSSSMATEYLSEHDRWVTSAAAERAELVRQIIDGRPVPVPKASATLGYPLERHHLAFVLWHEPGTSAAPSDLQRTATRLLAGSGCSATLVVPYGAASVWVWAAWRSRPAHPPRLVLPDEPGTQVAVGTLGTGVAGFRQSHREADQTAELVRSSATGTPRGSRATWYADVEIAVMLGQNLDLARAFVARELGPLAADTSAAAELRDTLDAYLSSERSLATAAEILHIARNTVAYRIKKIESRTGRDLRHRRLELESALRLARVLGPGVLTKEG
ncbi:PucR family transcriptional regulator [Actinocorallia sp. A-T 12471]|uniref:PucR family transcriptional regulator n=1 Tax=Actinocorallia sp. A-T 12471 TaxID=3089813 RepID=UPI0029CD930F|nr:helix-turn-helix domain-containing protein [Actinocorallia sp. A-T 12471]MDX6741676.1 helix-turn-helix domain-containing protein [Actinocorallia sp. A-T 12471]